MYHASVYVPATDGVAVKVLPSVVIVTSPPARSVRSKPVTACHRAVRVMSVLTVSPASIESPSKSQPLKQ